jgi:phage minor structural protein
LYQVSIYNNEIETTIHFPEPTAPKVLALPLSEKLSQVDNLTLTIPYNNPGYNQLTELVTKVKVINTRDNSIRFSGRVLNVRSSMDEEGQFAKEVIVESGLGYLNDTYQRRKTLTNITPTAILQNIIDYHNSLVEDGRKFYLGNVDVLQPVTVDYNYETSLNAVIKLRNILGGDIEFREVDGKNYIDYLKTVGANNEVDVRLGYNMKSIMQEYDPTDLVNSVIGLGYGEGVNQLNLIGYNGLISDSVDDIDSINKYGKIEGILTDLDIQNKDTLYQKCLTVLQEKKQPKLTLECSMLDLSVLTGHDFEQFNKGDTLHIINEVMGIDVYARVIELEAELLEPWNPWIVISTRPIRLSDQIVDLKQRNMSLENAPQGSTCIFPLMKAENADSDHPITFDLDIPKETININKVYLNLHGRRYRVDSKDASAGGAYNKSQMTSTSDFPTEKTDQAVYSSEDIAMSSMPGHHYHYTTQYILNHKHSVSIPSISIPSHSHPQVLGIVEGTFPLNVKVRVNGFDIGVNYGNGSSTFDEYNIDITPYVNIGNNKIELTTEQNGRIDAIVYSQIFIQAK